MLAIKNNLMADNAARHLGQSYDALSKSVERLSSGLRINSAKDDAAGMAVRELVRADISQLQQGARNSRDAISMLQTAEGAMSNIDDILVRMKELAEQAATDSYSGGQRTIMDNEFQQLASEITRVAQSTGFNGNFLLDPTKNVAAQASFKIHVGSDDTIDFNASDMTANGLGITSAGGTKTVSTNSQSVADAGAAWFTQAAGGPETYTFTFGGAGEVAFAIDLTANTAYSMNDIANLINAASNAGARGANAYKAASVTFDTTTQMYSLAITAQNAGDTNALTVTATTAGGGTANPTLADAKFVDVDGTDSGAGIGIDTTAKAKLAIDALTAAITTKDTYRASLGYMMNRLESAANVVDIQVENLSAAESRISDADVATEMAAMTRNNVLAQAGVSMLSQANQMPQMAMQLLRG